MKLGICATAFLIVLLRILLALPRRPSLCLLPWWRPSYVQNRTLFLAGCFLTMTTTPHSSLLFFRFFDGGFCNFFWILYFYFIFIMFSIFFLICEEGGIVVTGKSSEPQHLLFFNKNAKERLGSWGRRGKARRMGFIHVGRCRAMPCCAVHGGR